MKISKSKQELARIISENGGWRNKCDFAVQGKDSWACFFNGKPTRCGNSWADKGECQYMFGFSTSNTLTNWHQTILSRAEYFHLYPATDDKAEFCESVTRSIPEPESKPTIEQLAADYRNRKDYADRKQQEADAAKAEADAKLAELVAAGNALNLVISVAEQEPELVITDLLDLRVGDRIWIGDSGSKLNCPEGEYEIVEIDNEDQDQRVGVEWDGVICWPQLRKRNWKFIRRP